MGTNIWKKLPLNMGMDLELPATHPDQSQYDMSTPPRPGYSRGFLVSFLFFFRDLDGMTTK